MKMQSFLSLLLNPAKPRWRSSLSVGAVAPLLAIFLPFAACNGDDTKDVLNKNVPSGSAGGPSGNTAGIENNGVAAGSTEGDKSDPCQRTVLEPDVGGVGSDGKPVSSAHTAAVSVVGEVSRGGSIVTHWNAADATAITWQAATVELGRDEGPFY